MNGFLHDLRYGVRTFAKAPGFSAVLVLILALGIGANTAIFSVVRGVLLRPLPYAEGERIVHVTKQASLATAEGYFSVPEIRDLKSGSRTLTAIVEYHSMPFTLLGRGEPDRVQTGVVSAELFEVLGVKPLLGRTFRPGEDRPGAEPVLVLSHSYWRRRFGGDPGIVGQTFEMNDRVHTVVGVLPPMPQYPDENDVYMPVSSCPFRSRERFIENREARMMHVFAQLRDGVTVEQARSDLAVVADRLRGEHPEAYATPAGLRLDAVPLKEELTRPARPTLLLLLGTVGFVLLLVCANVANLVLARLLRRHQEMAVRTALGAGRGRLLRQVLVESLLLALAGGALGLLLAGAGLDMLVAFAARFTPRAAEVEIDSGVLLFTLLVAVATGVASGLLPAALSRQEPADALKAGGSRATAGRRRARSLLVVLQFALSFLLLAGAGLMLRSLLALERVDPGFRPGNVLTATLVLNWSRYTSSSELLAFFRPLLAE
ncbi:MAG TPA: ABC transporter permease, partial [Thermoanaerobaculia bacterium]|nr:ABC transporter permease [Thermoanaerobaculia bacterium]